MRHIETLDKGTKTLPDEIEGGFEMSRRRKSMMSDELKMRVAQELGFSDTLQSQGFKGVSSGDCGNMVKKAIEIAERNLNQR